MKKIRIGFIVIFICLSLIYVNIPNLFAEGTESEEFTLEEITVTAQKREENLQKVPIAMETISGAELMEMGKVDILDALSGVSNAIVQQLGNDLSVSIRGMDNDLNPGDSVSMVAINVDGAYSNSTGMGTALYDMNRIEVLSGPQSTLYSRNSTGGTINMVTNDPTDMYEGSGIIELGNYGLFHYEGVVNAPIADKLALRVAFSSILRDGYISNGSGDQDSRSGRIKLKYDPNDVTSIVLGAELARTGGKGSGNGSDVGGVELFADEDDVDDPWISYLPSDTWNKTKKNRYYMEMSWDLGIGQLTFLPAYVDANTSMKNYLENRDTGEYEESFSYNSSEEKSGELRLASSPDSKTTWIGGLYYYHRDFYMETDPQLAGTESHRLSYQTTPSKAVFANITYPVVDKFRVTLGGRYNKDEEDMDQFQYDRSLGYEVWDRDHYSSSHFDYKVGFEYDVGEQSMLWFDYSTGFRQGMKGKNNEYLDSFQAGSKSRFLNQRLQVNATAYYYLYDNYAVNDQRDYTYIDDETGESVTTIDRGSGYGQAQIYGFDMQNSYVFTDRDRIDLSASYMHTEISDLVIEFDYLPDYTGYEGGIMNNSPEWTITASYQHRFTLSNGGSITANIDTRYATKSQLEFFIEDRNVPEGMTKEELNTEPANHKTNLSVVYGSPEDKLSLSTYVKNIENHATKGGLMMGVMKIGAPRTYGAVLTIRF